MRGFQGAATHCDKTEPPLFHLCFHGVASGLGIGLCSSWDPGTGMEFMSLSVPPGCFFPWPGTESKGLS